MADLVSCRPYLYWTAFIAALGGFLASFATCIIAGALSFICREFHVSTLQEGVVASMILLGALAGSIFCGYIADRLGRRFSFFAAAFLFLATGILALYVHSLASLLILRFATGIAVGISSILIPMYLAEIAPPANRGAFVTSYQFSVAIGTFAAYLVSMSLSDSGNWRYMFFFAAIPAFFQLVALFFFPESPKWLASLGRRQESLYIQKKFFKNLPVMSARLETSSEAVQKAGFKELFTSSFRFVLLIGVLLSLAQQFVGVNAIVFFAPKIFGEAGFADARHALGPTLLLGMINCFSTFCSFFLIDRLGRRKLLLTSQLGVAISLGVLVMAFALALPLAGFIAVGALVLYIGSYALGLGPVTWVLISEIYPLPIRSKAIAFMTFLNWSCNYLVVLTFPYLLSEFGSAWTFSLYAAIAISSYYLCMRFIPETKGKSLEALEKEL